MIDRASRDNHLERWTRQLAIALWSGLLLAAWILAARAATGGLPEQLAIGPALCVTATTALLGLFAARLFAFTPRRHISLLPLTLSLAPTVLVGSTLIDVRSPMALLSLAGLVITLFLLLRVLQAASVRSAQRLADRRVHEELAAVPSQLTQQINRQRDPAGDRLTSRLQLEWLPGQQHQAVHIPFMPPFTETPRVSCDCTTTGGSVRSRIAQVRHFGARVELRRAITDDQPETTELTLVATAVPDDHSQAA